MDGVLRMVYCVKIDIVYHGHNANDFMMFGVCR